MRGKRRGCPGRVSPASSQSDHGLYRKTIHGVGLLIGFCAVVLLVSWFTPSDQPNGSADPARLSFAAAANGEVMLEPAEILSGRILPGQRLSAPLEMTNQTGRRLWVGLGAKPFASELAGVVRLRIRTRSRELVDGTLEDLRDDDTERVPLEPGARSRLHLTAWIPVDLGSGYQGRSAVLTLLPLTAQSR